MSGDQGDHDQGRERPPRNVGDLLQLCIENQSSTSDQDPVQMMSQERREWLEGALTDLTTDPVHSMKTCVMVLQNPESTSENKNKALDELVEWCENLDFAIDFHKIGAFPLLPILLNNEDPEIRWRTLELIATIVQNNTYCQAAALEADLLRTMLNILDKDIDTTVKIKALYAISCLTRDVPEAQKVFAENDGFSIIMRAMQCDVEKLKIKSAFMLSMLCIDNPAYKDILCDIGMIDQLVGELSGSHEDYHEHLMSALLSLVRGHQRAVDECQRPELQLLHLLNNRIQCLQGKEECNEEASYARELLKLVSTVDCGDVIR